MAFKWFWQKNKDKKETEELNTAQEAMTQAEDGTEEAGADNAEAADEARGDAETNENTKQAAGDAGIAETGELLSEYAEIAQTGELASGNAEFAETGEQASGDAGTTDEYNEAAGPEDDKTAPVTAEPLTEPKAYEEPSEMTEEASEVEACEEPSEMTEENPEPEKKEGGFFKRLFKGLSKTRESIASGLDAIFSTSHIDEEFYEEMEELLITGDIGVNTTEEIIEKLREQVKQKHVKQPQECRQLLADIMTDMLLENPPDYDYEDKRSVVLVVGVNGAGKTTTIGKLASIMKKKGRTVMVAAADTFRAAAGEQLEVWVQRAGADFIRCTEGQDPASVVYDAMQSAKARNTDIVFCDTAGRLHNKKNLMQELEKIRRVISRENPDAFVETLIVLDGTTGQNALSQAREFMAVSQVTGAVITKLDGTAKGGIAIAIQNELGIPVKYIGVGEAIEDLQRFDARAFVEALFVSEKDSEDS